MMKKLIVLIGLLVAFSSAVYADMSVGSLEKEAPSDLKPYGELAEMFKIGSDNTDIQREKKLKEITGKVVQWKLPVYEVRSAGNGYRIQTSGEKTDVNAILRNARFGFVAPPPANPVSTIISISARNEKEKQFIEALKTGDSITFKGVIKDVSMRILEIEPAILILDSATAETPTQPEPKQEVSAEQPKQETQQAELNPEPVATTENKTWYGDWGSGIVAVVSSYPCQDNALLSQNYNYLMIVSIPVSRLKKPDDAWQIQGDRAITIKGCWISKPDNMIHAKLNKKNGKTWEQDFKMTDGNWTAKGDDQPTNNAAPSTNQLDEANAKINTVWKGATKEVRAMLLPEQRTWLKQRENDCSLIADKENCMITMTNLRTEILKQKIAVLSK